MEIDRGRENIVQQKKKKRSPERRRVCELYGHWLGVNHLVHMHISIYTYIYMILYGVYNVFPIFALCIISTYPQSNSQARQAIFNIIHIVSVYYTSCAPSGRVEIATYVSV